MLVFVTGASGLVGTQVVSVLKAAGHTVTALARSDKSADAIRVNGADQIYTGSLTDVTVLAEAAKTADAVIHLGFLHDLAFKPGGAIQACETDRAAIRVMCDALVASTAAGAPQKVFLGASGLIGLKGNDEMALGIVNPHHPRYESDLLLKEYAEKGLLHTHFVRLAHVTHGPGGSGKKEHPFITGQIAAAKKNGHVGYLEDGTTKMWAACNVIDAAQVYVKALDKGAPAGSALHAIAEGSIPIKNIAEFIGRKLNLPAKAISEEDAMKSLGFVGMIMKASGEGKVATYTKQWLGWESKEKGLFEQLESYTF